MNNCYDGQDTVVLVAPASVTDTNATETVTDISAFEGKGLIAVNLAGIAGADEVTLQLYEGDTNVPDTLVETLATSIDADGVYEYDIMTGERKQYISLIPQVTGTVVISATLTAPKKYV